MAADKFRPHHPQEFRKLMEWASGCKRILEIGSRYGETLKEFAKEKRERIVSVDLPGYGPWGNEDSEGYLVKAVEEIRKTTDCHLILGNSRDPEVIERVYDLGPYDFVFIDGDHTYEGVKYDYENYGKSPMVVFHDIRQPQRGENQALEVWRLWKEITEIRPPWEWDEFLADGSKMGIGLVKS